MIARENGKMSEPVRTSPLAHRKSKADLAVSISEVSGRAMIDVRGLANDSAFLAAAKSALGLDLPLSPRTSRAKGGIEVLWMSVDQWLVCCEADEKETVLARLNAALEGIHSLIVDVSDARAIIRVSGEHARATVMKATSVDLLADDVKAGFVRRMLFAEIAALVHVRGLDPDVVDVYVFRSYADYAWDWLEEAAHPAATVRLFR